MAEEGDLNPFMRQLSDVPQFVGEAESPSPVPRTFKICRVRVENSPALDSRSSMKSIMSLRFNTESQLFEPYDDSK